MTDNKITPQTVWQDPEFLRLPAASQRQVLGSIDKDFTSLSPESQTQVFGQLRAKYVPAQANPAAPVQTPDAHKAIADAIANAEGFYESGSVPSRFNNPGDLKIGDVGFGTHTNGITKFDTPEAGWAALHNQVDQILTGKSRYKPDQSIGDIAKGYTGNDNAEAWADRVAKKLGVTPKHSFKDVAEAFGKPQQQPDNPAPQAAAPPQVNPAAPTQVPGAHSADDSIPATLEQLSGNISRDVSSGLTKAWTGKTPEQLPPWMQHVTGLLTGLPAGAAAAIPGLAGAAGRLYQAAVTDKTAGELGRHVAQAGAGGISNYFGMVGPGAIAGGLTGGAAKKTLAMLSGYAALQPVAHEAAQKLPIAPEYQDFTEQAAALLGGVGAEHGLHAAVEARNHAGFQRVRNQAAETFNRGIAKGLVERGESSGITNKAPDVNSSVTNQSQAPNESQPAILDTTRHIAPEPLKSATPAPQLPAKPVGPELAPTTIAPHPLDPVWDTATQQHNSDFAKLATPSVATSPPAASVPTRAEQPRAARAADSKLSLLNEPMQRPEPVVAQERVRTPALSGMSPEFVQLNTEYQKAADTQRKLEARLEQDRKAEIDSPRKLTDAAREKLADQIEKQKRATTDIFDRRAQALKNPESVKAFADAHVAEIERLRRTRDFLAQTIAHEPEIERVRNEIDQELDPNRRIALHESVGDKLGPALKPLVENKDPFKRVSTSSTGSKITTQREQETGTTGDPDARISHTALPQGLIDKMPAATELQQKYKEQAQQIRDRVNAGQVEMRRQLAELPSQVAAVPEGKAGDKQREQLEKRRLALEERLEKHGERTVFLLRTIANNSPSMAIAEHAEGATLRAQLAATTDPATRERLQTQLGDWERSVKLDAAKHIVDFGSSKYKQFNQKTADAIWSDNQWSRNTPDSKTAKGRREMTLEDFKADRPVRIAQLDQQIAQRQQELMRLKKLQPGIEIPKLDAPTQVSSVASTQVHPVSAVAPVSNVELATQSARGTTLLTRMKQAFPNETPQMLRERLQDAVQLKVEKYYKDQEETIPKNVPREVLEKAFAELHRQLETLQAKTALPQLAETKAAPAPTEPTSTVPELESLEAQAAKLNGRNYEAAVDRWERKAVSLEARVRALRHFIKTGNYTESDAIALGDSNKSRFQRLHEDTSGTVRIGTDVTPEAMLERAAKAGVSAYPVSSQRPAGPRGWLSPDGGHFISVDSGSTHEQVVSNLFDSNATRQMRRMLDAGWVRKSAAGAYEFKSFNPTTYAAVSKSIQQDLPALMRSGRGANITLEWTQPNGDPGKALFKTSAFLNDYGMDLRRAVQATQAQNYTLGSGLGGLQQWFDQRQREPKLAYEHNERLWTSGQPLSAKQQIHDWLHKIGDVAWVPFKTKVAPVLRAEAKARKAGVKLPDELASQIITTAFNSIEGAKAADAHELGKLVAEATKDIGHKDASALKDYLSARSQQDKLEDWKNKAASGDENAAKVLAENRALPAGVTKETLQADLDDIHDKVGPATYQKIMDHADLMRQHMKRVAQAELLDSGLISRKTYDSWKVDDRFYLPLNRFFPGKVDRSDPFLTSLTNKEQRAVMEAHGSTKPIADPIHNIHDFEAEAREVATQNRVNRALANAFGFVPEMGLKTLKPRERLPKGYQDFNVFDDGKPTRYALPKHLAEAMRFVDPPTAGIIEQIMKPWSRVARVAYTVGNPIFAVGALPAHAMTAWVGPGGPTGPIDFFRWFQGLNRSFQDVRARNENWVQGQRAGVMANTYWNDIAASMPGAPAKGEIGQAVQKVGDTADKFSGLKGFRELHSEAENALRLNTYNRLKAKAQSNADAAYKAIRYGGQPDFHAPRGQAVADANQLLMFLKANLSYMDQAHGLLPKWLGGDPKITAKERVQILSRIYVPAIVLSLAALVNNNRYRDADGTPSIAHVPEEDREQNYIWMTDKTEMLPNGHVTHVPARFRLGSMRFYVNPIRFGLEHFFSIDPQDNTWGRTMRQTAATYSPAHPAIYRGSTAGWVARTAGANLVPPIRVPFETALNMQFHTGGAIVPKAKEKEEPDAQTLPSTSPALTKLTPNWMSPARSEYLIRNTTGGLGGEAIHAADLLAGPKPTLTATERRKQIPLAGSALSKFYGPSSADQVDRDKIDLFYKWKDKAVEAKSTFDDYRKNDPAKAAKILADPAKVRLLSLGSNLAAAEKQLAAIRRQEDLVRKNAGTGRSPEAVMRTLSQLYTARQRILDSINATVAAVTK